MTRWLLALLLVAVAALTTNAGQPVTCETDCITLSMKEYVGMKVSLINAESDFQTCTNKLRQNQASNRLVMPDEMGESVLPARTPR